MQFFVILRRTVVPADHLLGIMRTLLMLWLMTMKHYRRGLCNGLEAFNNPLVAQFALCDARLQNSRLCDACLFYSSTTLHMLMWFLPDMTPV